MRAWLAFIGCTALILAAAPAVADSGDPALPDDGGSDSATTAIDRRIIVQWKPGVSRPDKVQARSAAGATDVTDLGNKRFQLLTLATGQDVGEALASLRSDPNVVVATRDGYSELHATQPNDPLFGQLWGLHNTGAGIDGFVGAAPGADINALSAWDKTVGDSSVIVADLDTGYRNTHPDLAGPLWTNPADPQDGVDNDGNGIVDDSHGVDLVGANADAIVYDGDATDDIYAGGHGVHTAGTIAAQGNNGVGITGVAQKTTLMPIRVCGWSPDNGGILCMFSSQIAGINYAGSHGARVANMSLGGTTGNVAIRNALAANPKTLYVISAGNSGQNTEVSGQTTYPCSYDPRDSGGPVDNVVCVAATDQADKIASFSNWGKTKVDLAAPGTQILSTYTHRTPYYEGFEAVGWPYAGWTAGGFIRTNASPLTSYGITNATGTQGNATTRTAVTPGTQQAGPTTCRLYQRRTVSLSASDSYNYKVFVDGSQVGSSSPNTSGYYYFEFAVPAGTHTLAAQFSYSRSGGTNANGVWLDDISFKCMTPVGAENATDYDFLEGTSMAAPHVSGAAALLVAYEPAASVDQLRQALLTSVDPIADLNPNTGGHPVSTGGRLDADSALAKVDALVSPNTTITEQVASFSTATVAFTAADTRAPATFECSLDGAGFAPCNSPVTLTGLVMGKHTYSVRAKDSYGNADPTPATANWNAAAPGKVHGLKVKRSKKKATVTWQAVAGADYYQMRWTKGAKKYGKWVSVTSAKKTIKRLKPNKKYKVQVVAVNPAGTSAPATSKVKKYKK